MAVLDISGLRRRALLAVQARPVLGPWRWIFGTKRATGFTMKNGDFTMKNVGKLDLNHERCGSLVDLPSGY